MTADWWGETQLPARSAAATAAICPAERFTALLVLMRSAVIAAFAAASVAVIAGRGRFRRCFRFRFRFRGGGCG